MKLSYAMTTIGLFSPAQSTSTGSSSPGLSQREVFLNPVYLISFMSNLMFLINIAPLVCMALFTEARTILYSEKLSFNKGKQREDREAEARAKRKTMWSGHSFLQERQQTLLHEK